MKRAALEGEQGALTLWLLGLSICLMFLGGLSLDLWRVFEVRRALAAAVDAAVIAGTTAIDSEWFRATGAVTLDPPEAHARAAASLIDRPGRFAIRANPDAVTVTGERDVALSLLGILLPDVPLLVQVSATAQPLRSP